MRTYKINRNTIYNEYVVKFYIDGKILKDAHYYTNCKQDAIGTGELFINKGM